MIIPRQLHIDIETYSDVDIGKAGLYKYAQSPAFDILLVAWALDDGPVNLIDLADPNEFTEPGLKVFFEHFYDPHTVCFAYNAAFEHYCLNTWLKKQGKRPLPVTAWSCVMAHAMYCGYPAGLEATGDAMGLPQDKKKLAIGKALIKKFCTPQAPDMVNPRPWRCLPSHDPGRWLLFKSYCMQDVEAEREIESRLKPWPMPEREHRLWEMTTQANARGVKMDRKMVEAAIAIGENETAKYLAEARRLTGLDNPNSAQQLMGWLSDRGFPADTLTKATVADLLSTNLPGDVRRVLELRQLMAKTSTKKYDAIMTAMCDDDRVRGLMQYYGASRSGRWAGRIVQPQNLPQNHLANLDYARQLTIAGDADLLTLSYGSIPDTLSQLIRTAFIPHDGCKFAVADYSAIEARVVAWLAGEEWVLDAFRQGQDIYCATASRMFGVPVEKHGANSHLRQRGKVATLALGYGGGESALEAMGAIRMGIPPEDLTGIKRAWRKANPAICRLWSKAEDAAIECVASGKCQVLHIKTRDPGRARANEIRMNAPEGSFSDYFNTEVKLIFRKEGDFLTIELPAGRKLFYANAQLKPAKRFPDRQSLHYMSQNQVTRKWALTDTWGGKLVENITQAVARDCLAETLIWLRGTDLDPVFHVHDEVICEITDDKQLDHILAIMAQPIDWAPGLPLKGAGFTCGYYQKD